MLLKRPIAAACVFAAALTAGAHPAAAQDDSATQIRQLDIMLMVTSLRCRHGEHDFQADYRRFARNNLKSLNAAHNQLRRELTARHGAKGSKRALDRLGVRMANSYGRGHPWMGCAELKETAQQLGAVTDKDALYDAAKRLLAPEPAPTINVAMAEPRPQVTPRDERIPYDAPGRRPMVATREQ